MKLEPMLAKNYDPNNELEYPIYVQPKLDGIRCIALMMFGECTLYSRNGKVITSMPHIVKQIEAVFQDTSIILDGELYNHQMSFEDLISRVKRKSLHPDYKDVQFHIFDVICSHGTFQQRFVDHFYCGYPKSELSCIQVVSTHLVECKDGIEELLHNYEGLGYEGVMIRLCNRIYSCGRTSDLLKVKNMHDSEFEICGYKEGKGKLKGTLGSFRCINGVGEEFNVKMAVPDRYLRQMWILRDEHIGQMLTVKYQEFTKRGVPRFPIGLRIQEEK